jgi:hypothetical protein
MPDPRDFQDTARAYRTDPNTILGHLATCLYVAFALPLVAAGQSKPRARSAWVWVVFK